MSFARKLKRKMAINYVKKEYGRIFCPKCHTKMILKDNVPVCAHCGWFKKEQKNDG